MKNLLFLLADQFRFDALGAENPLVQTPHLDALAEAGARFTRAYTPLPVCAPARQALYTGRHPDSFGAYWNYGFFPTPPISPEGAWPRALKAMGYSCGFIGKWNVSPADGPEAFGYDTVVSAAQYSDGGAQYTGGWLGCESPVPLEQAKTHWLADRAIEFIGAQRGPWHLFVDIGMPHLPCRPSAPFSRMYDPAAIPEWPGWNDTFENKPFAHEQQAWNWNLEAMPWAEMAGQVARYYGMVSQIDDAIGRILGACIILVSIVGLVTGNLAYLFGHALVSIYSADPAVIEQGIERLSIVSTTYALCGVMDVFVGSLRGMGTSLLPMVVSMLGACGLRILWIYTIFAADHTLFMLYLSYPVSWVITAAVHFVCYLVIKRKLLRREGVELAHS